MSHEGRNPLMLEGTTRTSNSVVCSNRGKKLPTIGKVKRDVELIKKYARFILVIGSEKEVSVIDNRALTDAKLPMAHLIAIVGETEYQGEMTQTVLLEIGYRKHRPYQQVCNRTLSDPEKRKHWNIKPRARIVGIDPFLDSELTQELQRKIIDCMGIIVDESRAEWKSKEPKRHLRHNRKEENFLKGVFFSVDKTDEWLYCQMILEHKRRLANIEPTKDLFRAHVFRIRKRIGKYRQKYSLKRLRRLSGALGVKALLEHYDCPIYQAILWQYLRKDAGLAEKALHVFHEMKVWLDPPETVPDKVIFDDAGNEIVVKIARPVKEIIDLLDRYEGKLDLPWMNHHRVHYDRRRMRRYQGQDCFVFEVIPLRADPDDGLVNSLVIGDFHYSGDEGLNDYDDKIPF